MNIPLDVKEFCEEKKIAPHLETILRLVKDFFNPLEVTLSFERDPESYDQWVAVTFKVEGTVEEVFEKSSRYDEKEVNEIPYSSRTFFSVFPTID